MNKNNKQDLQDKLKKIKQNKLQQQHDKQPIINISQIKKNIKENNNSNNDKTNNDETNKSIDTAKIVKAKETDANIQERMQRAETRVNDANWELYKAIEQRNQIQAQLDAARYQLKNADIYNKDGKIADVRNADGSIIANTQQSRAEAVNTLERQLEWQDAIVNTMQKQLDQRKQEQADALQQAVNDGILKKETKEEKLDQSEDAQWLKTDRKKYKGEHVLDASQDDPAKRKYINFKQDYVVIIRKKPFYAATAQQRYSSVKQTTTYKNSTTGTILKTNIINDVLRDKQGRQVLPEDNFLRAYQVNNFMNISITTTVHGPGTCSITMKGAERVVWAENDMESSFGFYDWSDLVGSWINVDEKGMFGDGTGTTYTAGSANDREKIAERNRNGLGDTPWARHDTYGTSYKIGQSWKQSTSQWKGIQEGFFDEDTTFRTLFKTREAKYGWRFAEKCDINVT